MTRAQVLILGVGTFLLGLTAYNYFHPAIDAGLRLINRKADTHELDKVAHSDPNLQKLVGGDDRVFGEALKNFGSEDGARRTDREAALARATNRIPLKRQPIVYGNQGSWQEHFTASEPLLVTVSQVDQVCSGDVADECARANGIYRDGTPKWYKGNKTVLQDPDLGGNPNAGPGGYRSLIVQTCANGCGAAQEAGFRFAACPADGRSTVVRLWTNAYSMIGPLHHNEDHTTAKGFFSYEVAPDESEAIVACRSHPDAGFVRLDNLLSPSGVVR